MVLFRIFLLIDLIIPTFYFRFHNLKDVLIAFWTSCLEKGMKLWDLVKTTFEDYPDSVWIHYCDAINSKNNQQLKFKTVFELSDLVIQQLLLSKKKKANHREIEGNNRCNIVGLWFDQSSDNILGHFVALVACLRSVFYSEI